MGSASDESWFVLLPRSQSSDNGAEELPDARGECHRQRTPECHSGRGAQNVGTAPALPPIAPRRARKPKEAAATIGTSALAGDTTTISKGMAAPTENDKADVSAA